MPPRGGIRQQLEQERAESARGKGGVPEPAGRRDRRGADIAPGDAAASGSAPASSGGTGGRRGIRRLHAEATAEAFVETGGASSSGDGPRAPRTAGVKRLREAELIEEERTKKPDDPDLVYRKKLLTDWAKGKLSSVEVQKHADAAQLSGAKNVQKIAGAGAGGTHPQNCQRALQIFFGKAKGAPIFFMI